MYSTYSQLWKFKNSVFKCQKIRRYVLLIVEKRIKHTYLAVNDVGLRHDKENCVQVLDTRRKQLVDLLFQFVTDESYKNVGGTQSAITHFTRTIFRNFFNCKVQKFTDVRLSSSVFRSLQSRGVEAGNTRLFCYESTGNSNYA